MHVRQKAGEVVRWVPHQMWGQNDVWRWDSDTQTYARLDYAEHVPARLSQGWKCFLCKTALRQTCTTHMEMGSACLTQFKTLSVLRLWKQSLIKIQHHVLDFNNNHLLLLLVTDHIHSLASRVSGENLFLILDDISTINTICSQKFRNSIAIGWLFDSMELNA